MGFFASLGTALGFINSNPTASELAKDISSGVDMIFYTKEEQAIGKVKATADAMEAWLRMTKARNRKTIKNLGRRRDIYLSTLRPSIHFSLKSIKTLITSHKTMLYDHTLQWLELDR